MGLWRDNVIIIGAGSAGKAIARGIAGNTHLGYNIIGFLDDDDRIGRQVEIAGSTYDVFGKIRHFTKFVNILNISTVIIAIPSLAVEKLAELTAKIQKHTKNILLIPDIKGVSLTNTELHHFFLQQMFLLKINNNLKSPVNKFIKRSLELAIFSHFYAAASFCYRDTRTPYCTRLSWTDILSATEKRAQWTAIYCL